MSVEYTFAVFPHAVLLNGFGTVLDALVSADARTASFGKLLQHTMRCRRYSELFVWDLDESDFYVLTDEEESGLHALVSDAGGYLVKILCHDEQYMEFVVVADTYIPLKHFTF